jgi:hypothetical protein
MICFLFPAVVIIANWRIDKSKKHVPKSDANATYCVLCRWTGISLPISLWMMGKNGGQFLSSNTIPARAAASSLLLISYTDVSDNQHVTHNQIHLGTTTLPT